MGKYLKFGGLAIIAVVIVFLVTACGQSTNNNLANLADDNSAININTNVNSTVNNNANTNAEANTNTSVNADVNINQEIIDMQNSLNNANSEDFNGSDLNDLNQ